MLVLRRQRARVVRTARVWLGTVLLVHVHKQCPRIAPDMWSDVYWGCLVVCPAWFTNAQSK
jgi:hypothetical protein